MSDTADKLIDIYQKTPDGLKPEVAPVLAGIMREQMALDRIHKETIHLIQTGHDSEVGKLRHEIESDITAIERIKIELALTKLCQNAHLVPQPVIDGLAGHCRFDDGELVILDSFGVPITFREAVLSLIEDD